MGTGTVYGMALHEGEPVEGVQVKIVDDSAQVVAEAKTLADGAFTLHLNSGTYTMQWTPPGGEMTEGPVEVPDGEDAEVELEV